MTADWSLEERFGHALARVGLAATDPWQPVETLSGGQRTRLALARVLLDAPDSLVASNQRVSLGPELTVKDPEESLRILIAPDAFGNIPAPILACHLAREVHDAVQVLALG